MTFLNRFIQYRNSHRVKYTREYVPVYGLSTKSQGWIAEVTTGGKVLDIFVAFLIIILFNFFFHITWLSRKHFWITGQLLINVLLFIFAPTEDS